MRQYCVSKHDTVRFFRISERCHAEESMNSFRPHTESPSEPQGEPVTGIILAGGHCTRISTNKALLPLGDRPIIVDIVDTLTSIFHDIILVTNRPEDYDFTDVQKVQDIIPGKGPLGGLYTGLSVSRTQYNFVVACDMPFLNSDLIGHMLIGCEKFDVVVPQLSDGLEPLHAIYSKSCLEPIQNRLHAGDLKLQSFFGSVRTKYIQQEEIKRFDPELRTFFNINYREDYQKVKRLIRGEDPKTWGD